MSHTIATLALALLLLAASQVHAEKSASDWLEALDRNQVMKSAEYTAIMTVHLPSGQERTFKMKGHVVGDKYALMEYEEPPRDAGTRYLRRDDQLWIYFPRVDRTMLVQGHMLREGVQGSDMSYEDMTQSSSWADKYTAKISSETDSTVEISMTSKDMSVSYPYREITIDKKHDVAVKVINYDASHYPIKEMDVEKIKQFGDRWFAVDTLIRSKLTEDKWTRFEITAIRFDVPYKAADFTKEALVREGDF